MCLCLGGDLLPVDVAEYVSLILSLPDDEIELPLAKRFQRAIICPQRIKLAKLLNFDQAQKWVLTAEL